MSENHQTDMKTGRHILGTIIFIVVLCAGNAYGQQINSYTISGIVIDNHSHEALFYANVGLLKAEDSTFVSGISTDRNGSFKIPNVNSGDYIFQASYIGYDVYWQSLTVTGEKKEIVLDTVFLQPHPTTLEGVTVYEKKPVYSIDGEKKLYNVSEDPGVQTGTASDALQNAPGVEVDIEGNITLRGVSSVEIWINDKPSRLNAENLKTYIQQLPANSLERIEVITNPSARYSAEGTGGIINIVTKSNIMKNSFITFGVNGSTQPDVSPWISYVYSNKKFSINTYIYAGYYANKTTDDGYNITFDDNMDTSNYKRYTSTGNFASLNMGLFINGSYNFDTMNSISFWAGMYGRYYSTNRSFADYYHQEYLSDKGIYYYTIESNSQYPYQGEYAYITYRHDFNKDGHDLSITLGSYYWGSNHSDSYKRLYQMYTYRNINRKGTEKYKEYGPEIEINYNLPYSKTGKIELGTSVFYGNTFNNWRIDTLFANTADTYVLDSIRYKDSRSKRAGLFGYLTVQQKIKNFTIKGGLRVEYRYVDYQIINAPQHNMDKDLPNFFPSLHLSYETKSMHNFTLSYTRRVSYPHYDQYNTFITYSEESYSTGNKDLRPTFSNIIEAEWSKYFDKFGSVDLSAYFSNSKNEVENLTDAIYDKYFGRYVSYSMPVNSGKSHRYGLSANVTYKLKSFMNIRLYANVYNAHSETAFRGETEKTDNLAYSFRLNFWAKLWKMLEVNLSGDYSSRTKSLFSIEQPEYSIDGGLRMDFWKKKISVFLNVQDIFNWNRQKNNSTNPYYISYDSRKYNSRYIGLGITFRFGKIEMESMARTGDGQMGE
jgi:outer membrane receptor protein involved in Fe transport